MQGRSFTIKGIRDGLLIELDSAEEWQPMLKELAAHLDNQAAFFTGSRVTVGVGSRPVRKDELHSIRALLERRNLILTAVQTDSQTTVESAAMLDLRAAIAQTGVAPSADVPFSSEEDGTQGVMIRRTLRSGRTVTSSGHVVVFGDVNAGAEIVAVGDVIIWGRLRGTVHAGAQGDETAVVCALDMQPTQMRIAGFISISPQDKRRKPKPETALVRNRQIIVEAWS